jgi:thiamine-monophosphate kinase
MTGIAREFELIRQLFDRQLNSRPDIALGIGDDAAITRVPQGHDLVTATDSLVAGTHFAAEADPVSVGHRSLAVNLSDLAAMGARPLWANIALHIPAVDENWLSGFAAGFFALAERCDVALIGGDTVRGPLAVTITVQGIVPTDTAITRAGAKPGDSIYVTGHPGSAAFARMHKQSDLSACFEFPEPRLDIGAQVRGLASAMIDVSDGLDSDLRQLLFASNVGAALDLHCVPVAAEVKDSVGLLGAAELALFGGEDYELAICVPADADAAFLTLSTDWQVPVTRLGNVTDDSELRWLFDGKVFTPSQSEFRHFA